MGVVVALVVLLDPPAIIYVRMRKLLVHVN